MTVRWIANSMGMTDAVWRRHANPWSVWTRFTCLPLIVLAIWSRDWIGYWALAACAVALMWTWVNPRLFAEPDRFDSWAARGVMGERIYLYHRADVPGHHCRAAALLLWSPLIGIGPLIWGLWTREPGLAVLGTALTMVLKLWFVDRMVWIAQDWRAAGHNWSELNTGR